VWVTADSAEPPVKSYEFDTVREDCKDWLVEDAVLAVGIQCLEEADFLLMAHAVPLLAEPLVLKGVDVSDVYPSSRLELVELVGSVWRGTQEVCKREL